jgi:hypothetical protein
MREKRKRRFEQSDGKQNHNCSGVSTEMKCSCSSGRIGMRWCALLFLILDKKSDKVWLKPFIKVKEDDVAALQKLANYFQALHYQRRFRMAEQQESDHKCVGKNHSAYRELPQQDCYYFGKHNMAIGS